MTMLTAEQATNVFAGRDPDDCGCSELSDQGVQTFSFDGGNHWTDPATGAFVDMPSFALQGLLSTLQEGAIPLDPTAVTEAQMFTQSLDQAILAGDWMQVAALAPQFYAATSGLYENYLESAGTAAYIDSSNAYDLLEACVGQAAETADAATMGDPDGFIAPDASELGDPDMGATEDVIDDDPSDMIANPDDEIGDPGEDLLEDAADGGEVIYDDGLGTPDALPIGLDGIPLDDGSDPDDDAPEPGSIVEIDPDNDGDVDGEAVVLDPDDIPGLNDPEEPEEDDEDEDPGYAGTDPQDARLVITSDSEKPSWRAGSEAFVGAGHDYFNKFLNRSTVYSAETCRALFLTALARLSPEVGASLTGEVGASTEILSSVSESIFTQASTWASNGVPAAEKFTPSIDSLLTNVLASASRLGVILAGMTTPESDMNVTLNTIENSNSGTPQNVSGVSLTKATKSFNGATAKYAVALQRMRFEGPETLSTTVMSAGNTAVFSAENATQFSDLLTMILSAFEILQITSNDTLTFNWVEKAGGLPEYIHRIAAHLVEKGMTEGHAIAAAVNTVKRWARGGEGVKADTVAKSLEALAEWELKKKVHSGETDAFKTRKSNAAATARAKAAAAAQRAQIAAQKAAASAAAKAQAQAARAAAAKAKAAAAAAAKTNTGKATAMLNQIFPPAFDDAAAKMGGNPNATAADGITLWAKYLDAGHTTAQMHTAIQSSKTFKGWAADQATKNGAAGTAQTPVVAPPTAAGTQEMRAPVGYQRDGKNVGGQWIPTPGADLANIAATLPAGSPAAAPLLAASKTVSINDIQNTAAAAASQLATARAQLSPADNTPAVSAAYDAALNRLNEAQYGNWSGFNPMKDIQSAATPTAPGFGSFAVIPLSEEDLKALAEFGVEEEHMPDRLNGGTLLVDSLESVASSVLSVANDLREEFGMLPDGLRAESGHFLGSDVEALAMVATAFAATARDKVTALVASSGAVSPYPVAPPRAWFVDPKLKGVTPITVTEDGHIYGHLASWDACHMESRGLGSSCVRAPRSRDGYSSFHLGYVTTAEGDDIPTGRIVAGAPHADPVWGLNPTLVHYSHSGWVGADVRAGEDRFGIWISGALRPDITPSQLRALKAAPLSGDWREDPKSGRLELVAALGVTAPGFKIPRMQALVASGGQVQSMFAVGMVAPKQIVVSNGVPVQTPEDLAYLRSRLAATQSWSLDATQMEAVRKIGISMRAHDFARGRKMQEMATRIEAVKEMR